MKKIWVLFLAASLAGCASNRAWTHPSKTTQDFYRDRAKCRTMGNSAGSEQIMPGDSAFARGWNQGSAIGAASERQEIFSDCMHGEGWYLVDKGRVEEQNEKIRLQKEAVEKAKQELSEGRDKYQDKLSIISIKGNEVIVDNNNHIMWPISADIVPDYIDWHSANKFIRTFNYAGYNDWRLPTEEELGYAYLGYNMFNNIKDEYYWSANTSDENFVKCFDMGKGYALSLLKMYEKVLLLPVRDNKEGMKVQGSKFQI